MYPRFASAVGDLCFSQITGTVLSGFAVLVQQCHDRGHLLRILSVRAALGLEYAVDRFKRDSCLILIRDVVTRDLRVGVFGRVGLLILCEVDVHDIRSRILRDELARAVHILQHVVRAVKVVLPVS